MGFADVTDDIRQMAGRARTLRVEFGCWSGAASASQAIATQLTNLVGGFIIGHDHAAGVVKVGSANAAGTADFTLSDATGGPGVYFLAGW
ncbi:MAG: hypothetical protein ACYS6W_16255 [Planctomycetota bacterium]|jgi:hypothetical protein